MFKKLLLIGVFSLIANSAFAVCGAIPLPILDGTGASRSMSSATAADGNCKTYIDADTASQIHNDLTAAIPAGTNLIGKVGIDQTTPGTTNGVQVNAALPAGANLIGYISNDPCKNATVKAFLPITATTSLVKVIATGIAAKKIYVCQINLVTTAANNVGVFEATTGTTCATSPIAVYGAATSVATAANGYPFPANGGISLGNGDGTVGITTVNNNDLCIATSAATPLTGGITYATQ